MKSLLKTFWDPIFSALSGYLYSILIPQLCSKYFQGTWKTKQMGHWLWWCFLQMWWSVGVGQMNYLVRGVTHENSHKWVAPSFGNALDNVTTHIQEGQTTMMKNIIIQIAVMMKLKKWFNCDDFLFPIIIMLFLHSISFWQDICFALLPFPQVWMKILIFRPFFWF